MGGTATAASAANKAATDAFNIKAAVTMFPAAWWATPITIPTFFVAADLDSTCPWQNVRRMFELTDEAPKVYLQFKDGGHWLGSLKHEETYPGDFTVWPGNENQSPLTLWIINYFNCHLYESASDCTAIYGTGSDSLCQSILVHKSACEAHQEPHHSTTWTSLPQTELETINLVMTALTMASALIDNRW
jgi:hypothetical protein